MGGVALLTGVSVRGCESDVGKIVEVYAKRLGACLESLYGVVAQGMVTHYKPGSVFAFRDAAKKRFTGSSSNGFV